MRVVRLSDHPGDELKRSRQRAATRLTAEQRRHQAEVTRLTATRDEARSSRRWLAWLRAVLALRRARRTGPATPVQPQSDREAALAAGVAGEQLVEDELSRMLNDDWVLFRGYRNRAGEIDHILLGPPGLAAIEVKNVNGTFHCDGDRWRVVKFDNYGNQVEDYELSDARGRSPSVQLNEPADRLEAFLHSQGEDVELLRIVLLTHRKAQRGTLRHSKVSVFTKTTEITGLMKKVRQHLTPPQRTRLEQLITRDHAHTAKPKRPGPRPR
jgi:hypothetical protein